MWSAPARRRASRVARPRAGSEWGAERRFTGPAIPPGGWGRSDAPLRTRSGDWRAMRTDAGHDLPAGPGAATRARLASGFGAAAGGRERGEQAGRGDGDLVDASRRGRRPRPRSRWRWRRRRAMPPLSPTPLMPSGLMTERCSSSATVERGQVVGARDRVVHEAAGQELAVGVVDDLLHQAGADALRRRRPGAGPPRSPD